MCTNLFMVAKYSLLVYNNGNYWKSCRIFDFIPIGLRQALRKQVYSNILKILPPKNEHFANRNSDVFHISAQNIDCGYLLEPPRRGGSN